MGYLEFGVGVSFVIKVLRNFIKQINQDGSLEHAVE